MLTTQTRYGTLNERAIRNGARVAMTVRQIPLVSTALSGATYDTDSQTLDIRFTSGRSYTFENVPEHVVDALEAAPSAGNYFANHIKGKF